MKKIIKFLIVVISLMLITILIAWLQAYIIDPLLYKPRTYHVDCILLINCTAEGIIFPRINCQGAYYGSECELRKFSKWYKKLD